MQVRDRKPLVPDLSQHIGDIGLTNLNWKQKASFSKLPCIILVDKLPSINGVNKGGTKLSTPGNGCPFSLSPLLGGENTTAVLQSDFSLYLLSTLVKE